jgi:phosphopantothenoylcysteine decarboxylase/phosphopantothenate--cysteine ligase
MKILLGVTGSIAAYKSYDLCRELTKKNHEVKVILTQGAEKFIKKETFTYLGAKEVFSASDDFNTNKYTNFTVLHIELTKWADKLVIAPASANKLSELSFGFANDLLTTTALAFKKDILIFPAMNTNMLNNKIVSDNIQRLKECSNIYIHGTKLGLLACGDEGEGKLEDVKVIELLAENYSTNRKNKKVLITTGATIAPLDPVRYVTNPSSGLTGYELALTYFSKGYDVILLAGFNTHPKLNILAKFPHIKLIKAHTTLYMFDKVKEFLDEVDTYISSAAISDIEFKTVDHKIKKNEISKLPEMKNAPDILKHVIAHRTKQKIVGFAAETENLDEKVFEKLSKKPVDLMIGNLVSNGISKEMKGFNQNANYYKFYQGKNILLDKELNKAELAENIFNMIENNESH